MNRAILVVICDFMVISMLAMMTGVSPGSGGQLGTPIDRSTAEILLEELRGKLDLLSTERGKLLEIQRNDPLDQEQLDELSKLTEELAGIMSKVDNLQAKLVLERDNAGELSIDDLQEQLSNELRKRLLAGMQAEQLKIQTEQLQGDLKSVSTDLAVSQRELDNTRKELSDRSDKLDATGAELGAAREDLAANKAELKLVRESLARELARLEQARRVSKSLEGDLSYAKGRLSTAERELADVRSQSERRSRQLYSAEIQRDEATRQRDEAQSMLQSAVGEMTALQNELASAKAELERLSGDSERSRKLLAETRGEAEAAKARLEVTQSQLSAAEAKLRNDLLRRYSDSSVRLTLLLNQERMLVDQAGGGVFYLPLIRLAGKTVMPGFHTQFFGDYDTPVNYDRVNRLEYRVNTPEEPLANSGTALNGPMLVVPGEPRLEALEFTMSGREPLNVITFEVLKERGLEGLFLFKSNSTGKESAELEGRCSLDLGGKLYIRNTTRSVGSELRAEPGDFVMTKQGDFVGMIVAVESDDPLGRRQQARCHLFSDSFSWENAANVPITKAESEKYFSKFGESVKQIRSAMP